MPHVTITMELPNRLIASLRDQLDRTDKNVSVRGLMNVMRGMLSPDYMNRGYMRACIASACAAQTVDVAYGSMGAATDSITIAGTALASVASNRTLGTTWLIGADNATTVANVVECINNNATISKLVRATAVDSDTFRITCLYPGPIGNLVTLAEAGNGFTLGAAALASGASDEVDGYAFGYVPTT
jgi:hypothetical protein